jgi:hypothetical protein
MSEIQVFETREDMIQILPKGGVIAELGVFKGEFSKIIDKVCEPTELYLIDIWRGERMYSGDADGNHKNFEIEYYTSDQAYNITLENVKKCRSKVSVLRKSTDYLNEFTDNFFDMIYIDADHSYEGVISDLNIAYKKIKNGGFIMGHDYEQNFYKTKNVYHNGVKRAVDEFCEKNNQKIVCKGQDGCVSYGIKIIKK